MKLTPYRKVAKKALMSWNGLSEEEATRIVTTQSYEELENQCYAENSMIYAVNGIAKILHLTNTRKQDLLNAVLAKDHIAVNEADKIIMKDVAEKWQNKEDAVDARVIDILEEIHDGWVKDNAKKFNKEGRENKRYQHLPIELIGFKEAKADLLFAEPILNEIGVNVKEDDLKDIYEKRCLYYFQYHNIKNTDDLVDFILNIKEIYPAVTDENTAKDKKTAIEMANQVITVMPQWTKKRLAELAEE